MNILLVVYDNGSHLSNFPMNMAALAAYLREKGVEVTIYNQDIHHYPDEHLTQYLDNNKFDFIGVGVIAGYYQYRKLLKISEAINRSKNRPFYMIGGHGPAPEPEFYLKKTGADAILRGEGEVTIYEIMKAVKNNESYEEVEGISFLKANKLIQTPDRKLIEDVNSLPMPAYDMFPIEIYRLIRAPRCDNTDFVMIMLSARGCTFKCNFCYRMDKGHRARSNEKILEEIEYLYKNYGINYIFFQDELLMSSVARTESFCKAVLDFGLKFKWSCNGRLNYAKPDLLKLMKQSGCVFINYGIECYDNRILRNMNKCLTVKQIEQGVQATLDNDISPGLNIIFGNIGENRETLQKGVDFLLKYDDLAQLRTIRPVTPYPGCELYYKAIEKGLIKDCEDFYENKHTNSDLMTVNFTELSDKEFYDAILEANITLLDNHFDKKHETYKKMTENLYLNRDASFRGYRHT